MAEQDQVKQAEQAEVYVLMLDDLEPLAAASLSKFGPKLADGLSSLGLLYALSDTEAAERALLRAVKISRDLTKLQADSYRSLLAATLNNLGIFYNTHAHKFEEARKAFEECLILYQDLPRQSPDRDIGVALAQKNLADVWDSLQQFDEADTAFSRAVITLTDLASKNRAYEPLLAVSESDYAGFWIRRRNQLEKAEPLLNQALAILRPWAKVNPDANAGLLCLTLVHLGNLYEKKRAPFDAEKMYTECLETSTAHASKQPEAYEPMQFMAYHSLGELYDNQPGRLQEAVDAYGKAILIGRKLVKGDPVQYRDVLIPTLVNYGVDLNHLYRLEEAAEAFKEAIVLENAFGSGKLGSPAQDDDDDVRFQTTFNYAMTLKQLGREEEAESQFEGALAICRRLAKADPDSYQEELAENLGNLGFIYHSRQRDSQAVPVLLEASEAYRKLWVKHQDQFGDDLAQVLLQLASIGIQQKNNQINACDLLNDAWAIARSTQLRAAAIGMEESCSGGGTQR